MELNSSAAFQLFLITIPVGLLVLFLFLKTNIFHGKSNYRLPPGPRPWPILGNLPLFGPLLHQDFKKLTDKYGPIVYLRVGSADAVVISSPDIAEEVLKTKDHIFASRAISSAGDIFAYESTDITFSPYGPHWRFCRKVFTLELMTVKRIRQVQKERKAEVVRALGSIIDGCKDGKAVRIEHKLWTMVSSNVCQMAFGKAISGESSKSWTDTESRLYEKTTRDVLELITAPVLGDFIPWLRHFDFHGYKKQMRKAAQQMDKILEKIIEEHSEKNRKRNVPLGTDGDDDKDLADVLLTRPGSDHETPLTRGQVKALLQDVLIAGTDTSITTLSWAFTELLKNPSALERAQEELDRVVGRDRLVEEKDLPRLPFVQAIVKETFRLHPVVPLLVPHLAMEASTLGNGYHIPKKCLVYVNTWGMGRDPTLWEKPLEFHPERFLDKSIDVHGQSFKFLPFGSGRRICPGKSLALVLVEYALAAMLHACSWALPDGMSPDDLDMTEAPGLTVPKLIPLDTVASPRLPVSVIFSSK